MNNQVRKEALRRQRAKFHREGPALYGKAYKTYKKWARPKTAGTSNKPYQTRLKPHMEKKFRHWVKRQDIPFDTHARRVDYDMRGYFRHYVNHHTGQPHHAAGQHFTDRYKTPFDTTFSSESKYANHRNPLVWHGNKLVNKRTGRVFFKPKRH